MTQVNDETVEIKSIILTFDICASSIIIEDLARADNLTVVRNMFIHIRDWLKGKIEEYDFQICNFTGDGWILVFPTASSGVNLTKFMLELLVEYAKHMESHIIPRMEHRPEIIGLSFGAAKGPIIKFEMFGRTEFVGRPINVACRLQGAIKKLVKKGYKNTKYKICIPRSLYHEKFEGVKGISSELEELPLHNIADGSDYQCVLVDLLPSDD